MTGEKNYCPFCSYSSTSKEQLESHINRYHEALLAQKGNQAAAQIKQPAWEPPVYNEGGGPGSALADCPECRGAGFVHPVQAGIVQWHKAETCYRCRPRWLASRHR